MRRLVSSVSVASWAICILLYLVINAGRANRVHACDGRRLLCDERQNARKPRAPSPGKWSLLEQGCQVSRIGREHLGSLGDRLGCFGQILEVHRSHRLAYPRSEEHTSELQSLMRISYAVFCLK